jgi:hypothetical protein
MVMTDDSNPFAELSLERAIALRWILRDIKARRMKLSPVTDGDLRTLIGLGLVEMHDDPCVQTAVTPRSMEKSDAKRADIMRGG